LEKEAKTSNNKSWQAWLKDPDGTNIELMTIDPDGQESRFAKEQE
jgi:hypothetical protein